MNVVCAWCGKEIESSSSLDAGSGPVISHGICDACQKRFFSQEGREFDEFLESLAVPIVVVDANIRACAANTEARKVLGKSIEDLMGAPPGNVFECVYADLPEGCGNTVHCSGCAIRRLTTDTYLTGNSHKHELAYICRQGKMGQVNVQCYISTEKIDEYVLLRVDEMLSPASIREKSE